MKSSILAAGCFCDEDLRVLNYHFQRPIDAVESLAEHDLAGYNVIVISERLHELEHRQLANTSAKVIPIPTKFNGVLDTFTKSHKIMQTLKSAR
ncbi:MAG: hypothetical protein WCK11_04610 [Candidatus Falkowbacteria bacterium]